MSGVITVTLSIGSLVYVVAWAIHTQIVHRREFLPAAARFETAHQRGDVAAMTAALEDEWRAHKKSFDFFWWARS